MAPWSAVERGAGHPVRQWPDMVLRHACTPVTDDELPRMRELAQRMIALVRGSSAWGLAAPQVGVSKRLFVFRAASDTILAVANPRLELAGRVEVEQEGCLSFGQLLVDVPRSYKCKLSAFDLGGAEVRLRLRDCFARVAQHEADHLDGRLILDFAGPATFLGLDAHPLLGFQRPQSPRRAPGRA